MQQRKREGGPFCAGAELSAEDQNVEEQEQDDNSRQRFQIKIELPEDPEESKPPPTVEALQQRVLELEAQLKTKDEDLKKLRAELFGVAMYVYDLSTNKSTSPDQIIAGFN